MRAPALLALAAVAATPAFTAQHDRGLESGEVVSGVRLGIGLGPSSPEPMLRLVFENAAVPEVRIPLGGSTIKGPIYNLVFRITSPAGQEFPLFDMSGPTGVHLKIEPIVADLARGQKYEILLPMNKLVYLDNGKNRTLPELLAQHYSVRAILDTTGDPRQVNSFPIWAGNVSSGQLRRN
jgi:hypothetical protein